MNQEPAISTNTLFHVFHHSRPQENRATAVQEDLGPGSLVDVNVIGHSAQSYSAWLGGSIVASDPRFYNWMITKEQYEEEGPKIARHCTGVFDTDSL